MRIHAERIRRISATCSGWVRDLYDWYHRPSTNELRGLKLLREWLSPQQLKQYDEHQFFDVTGCHTGKRYRISHGRELNICELDEACFPRSGWCFVPESSLVAGDVMLAQKIALETDELGALTVARSFTPRAPALMP